MNTQLIADAVRTSKTEDESTIWDRISAFWFRRLVYTQIWEDTTNSANSVMGWIGQGSTAASIVTCGVDLTSG